MFHQWLYIGLLVLISVPIYAQNEKAIKRKRQEMISEQRVALVIGNEKYKKNPLDNPVNDAGAIAAALKACGFTVLKYTDLNRIEMFKAVQKFGERIKRGGVGLFYYSGHGIQVAGKNYLIPVDADIKAEDEVEFVCLDMQSVLNKMETAGNRVNILVLDACRDNPFASQYKSSGSGGLAGISEAPGGTFIAYATAPGRVALDGRGSNSPFTEALVEKMNMPGLKIEEVFKQVRQKMKTMTNENQIPWQSSSLTGDFYFRLPSNVPSPSPIPVRSLHEAAGLNLIEEVRRLLMRGTQVNARDKSEQTPLHTAARFNARETAEVLLNQHADANLRDNAGQTPLHVAARYKADEVAELLLSRGAEVDARDNQGRTPLDIANSSQAEAIIEILRRYSALAVGSVFRDCVECPEMVVVPSGSFLMGSPNSEDDRYGNEGPRHRVNIGYSLAVGVYEVTFAEWNACVADGGCGGYRPNDRGWGRGNQPVIHVNWKDAQSYVRWLSAKTGHNYRLLSESEWEYVARAGTGTPFHFGSTISTDQANYYGHSTYGTGRRGVYREKTVPVGSFNPNAWGIYDMHGNVWEWVEDCWNDSYEGAPADGSAWESGDCNRRVLRGGSWYNEPRNLRSASRSGGPTDFRLSHFSFRVAWRF